VDLKPRNTLFCYNNFAVLLQLHNMFAMAVSDEVSGEFSASSPSMFPMISTFATIAHFFAIIILLFCYFSI
jgi:hypothetical protein